MGFSSFWVQSRHTCQSANWCALSLGVRGPRHVCKRMSGRGVCMCVYHLVSVSAAVYVSVRSMCQETTPPGCSVSAPRTAPNPLLSWGGGGCHSFNQQKLLNVLKPRVGEGGSARMPPRDCLVCPSLRVTVSWAFMCLDMSAWLRPFCLDCVEFGCSIPFHSVSPTLRDGDGERRTRRERQRAGERLNKQRRQEA